MKKQFNVSDLRSEGPQANDPYAMNLNINNFGKRYEKVNRRVFRTSTGADIEDKLN